MPSEKRRRHREARGKRRLKTKKRAEPGVAPLMDGVMAWLVVSGIVAGFRRLSRHRSRRPRPQ
jgi:hypothetical protein